MIHNTIENIETSKGALKGSLEVTDSSEQWELIEAKNERRQESLQAMRSEVKDEARASQNNQYQ
jgi:small acid-soluble spore protein (thioredoxin-like protein)